MQIVRITEKDLHNIIRESVNRILNEEADATLLQSIAQGIIGYQNINVNRGSNDLEVQLQDNLLANIKYQVESNPYVRQGMKSGSYDVPDDDDEIIDSPTVEYIDMVVCRDGECYPIEDNGIVKKALERVISLDYSGQDLPSERDFYQDY
jgi:hypothetical protein